MNEFRCIGRTDTGLVRDGNEDTFVANRVGESSLLLCAVIDGVGGYEGGEVAAKIAADTILSYVEAHVNEKPLDLVKEAVTEANNVIFRKRNSDSGFPKMGCVASVALVDLNCKMAHIAHVGDTRIYLYGPDGLRKITHDHSLVGYMEDHEDITEFQAMNHPQRNEIERFLGDSLRKVGQEGFVESGIYPIPAEGKLLLCSDGLTDMVASKEISKILSSEKSTASKVDSLIVAANSHGGKDNVTVVLVEFLNESAISPVVGMVNEKEDMNQEPNHFGKIRVWVLCLSLVLGIFLGYLLGLLVPVYGGYHKMQQSLEDAMELFNDDDRIEMISVDD